MNRIAFFIVATVAALLLFSCKSGNGSNPDNPLNQKKADIVHKYTITSQKPVEISFVITTGLDDIFFNGVNEKVSILTKKVMHDGTKEYTIKTNSKVLTSATLISQPNNEEVSLTYVWKAYANGKEVKNDAQTVSVGSLYTGKTYATTTGVDF